MSLTVKAYLEKDGKPDGEIRRFSVPADVSSSYDYLVKKIASVFPSLREGHFSLYWKDPDGDKVSFSADIELLEALGFVTDSVLKIFITAKPKDNGSCGPTPEQAPQDCGMVHVGVICDGCNGNIKGIRYKCMECEDYDLCATCEQKGIHTHNMMKISKPNRMPFYLPPQRGHAIPRCGRFPGAPGGHGEFAPPPHFRRWMRRFMRRWHSQNSSGCPVENDSPDDELSPTEGFPDWTTKCAYKQKRPHKSKGIKKCCTRKPATIDLTKEVTEKMDTMNVAESQVEPIARESIDLTEKIVSDEPNCFDLTELTVSDDSPVKEAERQPMPSTKMDVQRGSKEVEDNAWTLLRLSPTPDETPEVPTVTTPMVSTQTVASPIGVPPTVAPPTVAPPMMMAPQPTVSSPLNSVQVPPVQGPASIVSNGSSRGHSVQFQLPAEVVYPPSNPRVAEALQQMMAMGFNNDQGWLTRLLEAKNGDIIQVLDAIKPQPGRSRATNGGFMA